MNSVDPALISGPIGHVLVGLGPTRVIVMNDWLCDTSTWDDARTFLDGTRFTFAFADLRGYGRSRGRGGAFTIDEAASDVLTLADALGWDRFAELAQNYSMPIFAIGGLFEQDRETAWKSGAHGLAMVRNAWFG